MVIFLISLTYISTWNLKKHYFFSTYFLWEQKICVIFHSATASWLMSTICAVYICIFLILSDTEHYYTAVLRL